MCATRHLCTSADCVLNSAPLQLEGRFRSAMVRMMSVSLTRVKCCGGPSARTLVLFLGFRAHQAACVALMNRNSMFQRATRFTSRNSHYIFADHVNK